MAGSLHRRNCGNILIGSGVTIGVSLLGEIVGGFFYPDVRVRSCCGQACRSLATAGPGSSRCAGYLVAVCDATPVGEFAPYEISAALTWTRQAAATQLDL